MNYAMIDTEFKNNIDPRPYFLEGTLQVRGPELC
jgi:hypothetical protein